MSEKIRKPRKPKPANPVPPPAPEAPAPVPAPKVALGSYGVPSIDKHDALFVAASRAVEAKKGVAVPPRFLKAVMGLESGENGDYPVDRCRPSDGHPGPRSCGPMQIKWPFHAARCPECSQQTVAGHVEMAAHIIADAMTAHRCDEYEAYVRGYLTSDDVNGTSQREAVAGLRRRVKAMEADAATGTTPTPETTPAPKPTDPLSVIVGGVPYTAEYGFDDQGPAYYAYFDRAHGNDTDDDTSHPGVDVMVPLGTKLYAPAAGVVTCVGAQGRPTWGQGCGYYADTITGGVGNITILLNAGPKLVLGHSKSCRFKVGDRVTAGDWVGTSGGMNSPHVHVEVAIDKGGSYWIVDPVPALREVMAGRAPDVRPTLNVEIAIADGAGLNRPKTKLLPGDLWVTVHETANEEPGADARMHRDFVNTGGGPEAVSFHFAVDDRRAVQILPLDEVAYHAGDRCDDAATDHGCFRSVAIEVCVNAPQGSSRWAKAKGNAAALIAGIVATPEKFVGGKALAGRFSVDRIAPHQKWSGKNCPTRMLAEGSLPAVVAEARSIAAGGTTGTTPAPEPRPDDVLLALFPDVDLSGKGVVSAKWLACRERDGQPYPFIRRHDAADGSGRIYWVFAGLVLRSKDGTVEEVAA